MSYEKPLTADEFPDPDDIESETDNVDLEPCPACGEQVYEYCEQCPHCGEWVIRSRRPRNLVWTILVVGVLAIFLMGYLLW